MSNIEILNFLIDKKLIRGYFITMKAQLLNMFDEVLEPLGKSSAEFFLAASLYHAQKISFKRAAELSGLSFDDFRFRLNEHFDTGYILFNETVEDDIKNSDEFILE